MATRKAADKATSTTTPPGAVPVEDDKPTPQEEPVSTTPETPKASEPETPAWVAKLRAPFPPEQVGKLPRVTCRDCIDKRCSKHRKAECKVCDGWHSTAAIHLDYVGHADITARLLDVDPFWTWEPFTAEEMMSLPPAMRDAGLWIHLTVCGVTRTGFGDAQGKQGPNAVKEAIGDALRNAAMRFGAGLELWAKGDREYGKAPDETPEGKPAQERAERPPKAERKPPEPLTAENSPEAAEFWKVWNEVMDDAARSAAQKAWPFPTPPGNFTKGAQFAEASKFLRDFRPGDTLGDDEAYGEPPF